MVIVQGSSGGKLESRDIPRPEPGPEELLMKVKAASVNRADLYMLQGTYDPAAQALPVVTGGIEAAGEVAGFGEKVSGFSTGEPIMVFSSGAYAEYMSFDHRMAMKVPGQLNWEEAATIPLAYMTVYNALIQNADVKKGEAVLINAASSGIGVTAIQAAGLFGAGTVIGMSGSSEKLDRLRGLGMDVGINYRKENFSGRVLAATDNAGADVIIDHVGGSILNDNLRCMAVKGRLISIGRLGGTKGEIDMELMALKRIRLKGVTFRTRTIDEKMEIVRGAVSEMLPALEEGRLRPVIDRVFDLEQVMEAQAYMASNLHVGKIVLKL